MSIVFCFYSVYDLNRTLEELSNKPGTSGIDYLGIGWGYGIVLFFLSISGLPFSIIATVLLKRQKLRNVSQGATILFVLLITASICLFYA